MRRYATWLRKEWRDQRAVTIGVLVAIPALTAIAYAAFGMKIGTAHLSNVRPVFLAIATGLVVFAIASDLFAGENRRGTIRALRRLPGAMGSAFAAKVTFLALMMVAAITLQGLSLAVAEHVNAAQLAKAGISDYHLNGASRSRELFEELGAFPHSVLWLTGLGFAVVGLWTLLVSSWMGRSGVAGIGAVVLLAALATPFFLFFRENPWFFPGPLRLASWTAAIAALVALAATALSFLRGQRFLGRPLRPFLLGASLVLLCLGGGYVHAQQRLDAWIEIEPTDKDFRIWEARMGAGGEHLYLTVHRGTAWNAGKPMGGHRDWEDSRGTPLQAWVVDLATGAYRPVADRAQRYFDRVPECAGLALPWAMDPAEALVAYQVDGEQVGSLAWWDARAGKPVRTLPPQVRDATALELVRRCLRADTWVRDSEGRRVWLRDGIVEREGEPLDSPAGIVPREARRRGLHPVPGGWFGLALHKNGAIVGHEVIDARTGASRVLQERRRQGLWYTRVLSPEHAFSRQSGRTGPICRLDATDTLVEPKNPPAEFSSVIGRNLVLALRGEKHAYSLHAWNPLTGEDRPLTWTGTPLAGISEAYAHGRTGDGRILLRVTKTRPGTRAAWVLLHADLEHLTTLRPWARSGNPVALMPDDALVMLEDRRRVVRYAPHADTRVLFPRD